MEAADFSGYATKADLRCSDGRTIKPNAFEKQHGTKVPLVWHHSHDNPENVLGHVILENREDGVYAYGFFNETSQGKNARSLVQHGDITNMSIYANGLVERAKEVLHGAIREVSLVLSGANPGAVIEQVRVAHADGFEEDLDDTAIIHTGLPLDLEDGEGEEGEEPEETPEGGEGEEGEEAEGLEHSEDPDQTVADIYHNMSDTEKEAVHYMIGEAVERVSNGDEVAHAVSNADRTIKDVYDAMSDEEKDVLHYLVGEAVAQAQEEAAAAHSATNDNNEDSLIHQEGTTDMSRNVFADAADVSLTHEDGRATLSHDAVKSVVSEAQRLGSFKEAMLQHAEAQSYGIENIDLLFPDPKSIQATPEWISRRMEWVAEVLGSTRKSPFSRIKSTAADITADEARAKGYVKGNRKKDEVLKLLRRVTTPKTIYKKQKLDRDDILDITDLDVVAWLKAEMRLMLDEEIARGILIGDGREPDDEDKIDEDHLRPIAYDDDMYTHKVNLPSNTSAADFIKAVLRARVYYKGSGTPTLFTTDEFLTDMILLEDKQGRRLYETEQALAAALRVRKIVPVEVMNSNPDLMAVMVNLADYTVGADRGGEISTFEDFDIDFNQQKYLIETRISGALTKPKSAVSITKDVGTVVTPQQPSYNPSTHVITIPSQTGVVYKIDGVAVTGTKTITEDTEVEAFPANGYAFPHNTNTSWTYVY